MAISKLIAMMRAIASSMRGRTSAAAMKAGT
jgi:hypothetical protein